MNTLHRFSRQLIRSAKSFLKISLFILLFTNINLISSELLIHLDNQYYDNIEVSNMHVSNHKEHNKQINMFPAVK